MTIELPSRSGAKPRTTDTNPHSQLDQNAPQRFQEALWGRMAALADVETGQSLVSVPGARAIFAKGDHAPGCADCFMEGGEFAHIHPVSDGSLHIALPEAIAAQACGQGWAELHPLAASGRVPRSIVMVYGPRDEDELEVIWNLIRISHGYATGAKSGIRK